MLILNELTLRKFRIHENLTIKFGGGVTGIVGRNGTGKSSIIEAIGFLFTGEADDPKEKVITSGATGTSYVRGKFTLNGKQGVIERSLDTSKVTLVYDGQSLVKAGEVKELWAKLLQVDNHIFQHVIMARQQKMAELFSGESAVREKAFQKIFMVPNTERVRTIIWDYIKSCPPPLPEDNVHTIDQQIAVFRTALEPKREKLALISASVLNDQQMSAVIGYTNFYSRCLEDAQKRPQLEAQATQLQTTVNQLAAVATVLEEQVAQYPPDLDSQYSTLLVKKEQHRVHTLGCARLADARAQLSELRFNGSEEQGLLAALEQQQASLSGELGEWSARARTLQEEVNGLQGLSTSPTCPTCKQPLTDVPTHLRQAQEALASAYENHTRVNGALQSVREKTQLKRQLLAKWTNLQSNVAMLEQQVGQTATQFNPTELRAIETLRDSKTSDVQDLAQARNSLVQTEAKLTVLHGQISRLVAYDGASTPEEELTLMQEVLQRHRARIQDINLLEKEIVELQTEIRGLEQRRVVSVANHEKNLDRTEYNNKLRIAYDVLHTSQFPRQLVQTYSSVVEEELLQQLQRFEIPYQAKINDEFRIVVTKGGNTLPRLSGGQEMIVGLCLRLALHSMFSQSFPMLVIDEGTTHLDSENQKLYFQCIDDLKKDKVIKQLIIIDHSSLLTEVVDQVVQL